jgi:hypothetical protein
MEKATYTPGPLGIKGPVMKDGVEDFAVVAGGQIIAGGAK